MFQIALPVMHYPSIRASIAGQMISLTYARDSMLRGALGGDTQDLPFRVNTLAEVLGSLAIAAFF